jgi:hypothetical protein
MAQISALKHSQERLVKLSNMTLKRLKDKYKGSVSVISLHEIEKVTTIIILACESEMALSPLV